MNINEYLRHLSKPLESAVFALMAVAAPLSHAGTVWTGPVITYSQTGTFNIGSTVSSQMADVDQITADVWLTRPSKTPMVNAAPAFQKSGKAVAYSTTGGSPSNTLWAAGTLAPSSPAMLRLERSSAEFLSSRCRARKAARIKFACTFVAPAFNSAQDEIVRFGR